MELETYSTNAAAMQLLERYAIPSLTIRLQLSLTLHSFVFTIRAQLSSLPESARTAAIRPSARPRAAHLSLSADPQRTGQSYRGRADGRRSERRLQRVAGRGPGGHETCHGNAERR